MAQKTLKHDTFYQFNPPTLVFLHKKSFNSGQKVPFKLIKGEPWLTNIEVAMASYM